MKILIIGLGSIARKHITAIRLIEPNSVIYALRSSSPASLEDGVINIYSLGEVPVSLDFIIIANPTKFHEVSIKQCLDFNIPLFIEKPVLSDLANADRLIKEISRKVLITYVACNLRFHPAIQYLRKYIEEKNPRINEVNIYCGSYLPDWRADRDFREVYSIDPEMGGGVHLDLIHELDYCKWIFGTPDKIKSVKSSNSSLNIEAMDYAQFNYFYQNFVANIKLNYYRRDTKRVIEMITDKETLEVDLIKNKIVGMFSGKVYFEIPFQIADTYLSQMQYFMDCIREDLQPMNGIEEGIEALKIALYE